MGRYKSSDGMIFFTGIVGLLMLGGLMLGPADPDVDLTALEDADAAAEDTAQEELSALQNGATAASDILSGTDLDDVIDAMKGDDQVNGYAGDDRLSGGAGDDQMLGGDGNDTLLGESGQDDLHGGFGNDQIDGGEDADKLWGHMGNDTLSGIDGNDGNDNLAGGAGEDVLFGGNGDDHLEGGADTARDFLNGGRGDDLLIAQEADVLTGGEGSDTFAINTSAGSFDETAQIIDFIANEDQIEIMLDETNFDQGLKNIRIETNDIGQSVVYLNNEAIVAINAETPLLPNDIVLSKAKT